MASCIAGCVLVLINIPFFLIGLLFTGLGGIVKFGGNFLAGYVKPMFNNFLDGLPQEAQSTTDVAEIVTKLLNIISGIAIGLIIFGIFLLVLSVCGMCGVCCKSKILLIVYLCVVGAITIAMLGIGIWIITGNPSKIVKAELTTFLKGYKAIDSFDFNSLITNLMQSMLSCCGINNGSDFHSFEWKRQYNTSGILTNISYPVTCCQMDGFQPKDKNCTLNQTSKNSYIAVGCWGKIAPYITMTNYGAYAMFGLCGFLVIMVLLAVLYMSSLSENKIKDI